MLGSWPGWPLRGGGEEAGQGHPPELVPPQEQLPVHHLDLSVRIQRVAPVPQGDGRVCAAATSS